MLKRALLCLCLLTMSVAGLTVVGATPASAGLTPDRKCANFDSSNNRRLSICARGWVADPAATQWRGVVEMHTYILVNGHPIDRTSQSITVNQATFWPMNADGKAIVTVQDSAEVGSQGLPWNSWRSTARGFLPCLRAVET